MGNGSHCRAESSAAEFDRLATTAARQRTIAALCVASANTRNHPPPASKRSGGPTEACATVANDSGREDLKSQSSMAAFYARSA